MINGEAGTKNIGLRNGLENPEEKFNMYKDILNILSPLENIKYFL
jgi:hypothetical protein